MSPKKIAYCIWIVIALLGVVCWLVPKEGWEIHFTLRWPTLEEMLYNAPDPIDVESDNIAYELDSIDYDLNDTIIKKEDLEKRSLSDSIVIDSTLISTSDSVAIKVDTIQPDTALAADSLLDTRIFLKAFYQSLDSTTRKPIRVVHYGDSQIEEDRITNMLREALQKRYGGGGPGILPLLQTIPTRTVRQWLTMNGHVQNAQSGPKRYLAYGPEAMQLKEGNYGVMGQVAMMNNSLVAGSEKVIMNVAPFGKENKPHSYFNRIRLVTNNIQGHVALEDTSIQLEPNVAISIPDSTNRCKVHLSGKGSIYGISFESSTGVIVDNIPMRGCSGRIFTRINSSLLNKFFTSTNTRLIILQYGGNTVPNIGSKTRMNEYVEVLRRQVRHMRASAPHASILFIGPSDMTTRRNGALTTYPLLPYLDAQLLRMAKEEHIAYWSMYHAMGGRNSMIAWYNQRLAGGDYVHFTRAGANKIGKMLSQWIEDGKHLKLENPAVRQTDTLITNDTLSTTN
jgi:lysophospholipase L1-like esterase